VVRAGSPQEDELRFSAWCSFAAMRQLEAALVFRTDPNAGWAANPLGACARNPHCVDLLERGHGLERLSHQRLVFCHRHLNPIPSTTSLGSGPRLSSRSSIETKPKTL
jgi:hypothetical protein